MSKYLIALAVLACVSVIYALVASRMLKRKRARFSDRQELATSDLVNLFMTTGLRDTNDLDRFLDIIADEAEVPKGLLRPDDRFDSELRPERGWEYDNGVDLLPSAIARAFGGSEADFDLSSNPTVGLLARSVAQTLYPEGNEIGIQ